MQEKTVLEGRHSTDSDIWSVYLEKQLDELLSKKEAGEEEEGEVQTGRGAQVHQPGLVDWQSPGPSWFAGHPPSKTNPLEWNGMSLVISGCTCEWRTCLRQSRRWSSAVRTTSRWSSSRRRKRKKNMKLLPEGRGQRSKSHRLSLQFMNQHGRTWACRVAIRWLQTVTPDSDTVNSGCVLCMSLFQGEPASTPTWHPFLKAQCSYVD